MSDFFRNLASRASGSEDAVRPRGAGRFEQSETQQFVEVSEEIERTEVGAAQATTRTLWPPPPPQFTPKIGEPPEPIAGDDATQIRVGSERGSMTERVPVMDRLSPPKPDDRLRDEIAVQPVREQAPPSPGEPTTGSQQRPAYEPLLAIAERTAPAANVFPSVIATPATALRAVPLHEPVAAPRRPISQAHERSAAGETVVHVNIGRIELKASPAAPPPRAREKTPSPVRTLAEYLQQHAAERSRP